MKKLFAPLLLTVILLSACGNTQNHSSSSQATSSSVPPSSSMSSSVPASSSESSSEASKSQSGSDGSAVKTFGVSIDDFAKVLKDNFTSSDMPNAFDAEPTTREDESADLGKFITYTYPVATGVDCILYANAESKELLRIFVYASVEKMDNNSATVFGYYLTSLVGGLEPDVTTLDKVYKELDMAGSDLYQDKMKLSSGTIADFSYMSNKGTIMLMISPTF